MFILHYLVGFQVTWNKSLVYDDKNKQMVKQTVLKIRPCIILVLTIVLAHHIITTTYLGLFYTVFVLQTAQCSSERCHFKGKFATGSKWKDSFCQLLSEINFVSKVPKNLDGNSGTIIAVNSICVVWELDIATITMGVSKWSIDQVCLNEWAHWNVHRYILHMGWNGPVGGEMIELIFSQL